ncbi:MAG: hypothetical protein IKP47_02725 [Ruminococcus sp.]|nr:hypothetical protein [Ruminococcus sp.]
MQEKKKILIILDYLIGPIRASFDDQLMTGVPVIDEDDMLKELNLRIGDMYSGYYEFDSHGQGCRFDEERFRAEKGELLDLLGKLIGRLGELNDGSYEIDDQATAGISQM